MIASFSASVLTCKSTQRMGSAAAGTARKDSSTIKRNSRFTSITSEFRMRSGRENMNGTYFKSLEISLAMR